MECRRETVVAEAKEPTRVVVAAKLPEEQDAEEEGSGNLLSEKENRKKKNVRSEGLRSCNPRKLRRVYRHKANKVSLP